MSNDEMDTALLRILAGGPKHFDAIRAGMVIAPADEQAWRQIDRRLQALRKRGLIASSRKLGWSLVQAAR